MIIELLSTDVCHNLYFMIDLCFVMCYSKAERMKYGVTGCLASAISIFFIFLRYVTLLLLCAGVLLLLSETETDSSTNRTKQRFCTAAPAFVKNKMKTSDSIFCFEDRGSYQYTGWPALYETRHDSQRAHRLAQTLSSGVTSTAR